jgi:hypothetical protein
VIIANGLRDILAFTRQPGQFHVSSALRAAS